MIYIQVLDTFRNSANNISDSLEEVKDDFKVFCLGNLKGRFCHQLRWRRLCMVGIRLGRSGILDMLSLRYLKDIHMKVE